MEYRVLEIDNPLFTADFISPLNHPVVKGRPFTGAIPILPVRRPSLHREYWPPGTHMGDLLGIHPLVLLPFFFAVLVAINIGAFAASRLLLPPPEITGLLENPEISAIPETVIAEISAPVEPSLSFEGLSPAFLREPESQIDPVMDAYRNPETRVWVTAFFERICGSHKIAQAILEAAERYSIPPSLAFALSWEESRFNFRAVNRKNRDESIDRGLFQLNNKSFPKLGEAEFFDPRLNAFYGMAHLRICIDMGGSEIAALAMYNAGTGRVRSGGTPYQTLNYTAKVISTRAKIDKVFQEEWTRSYQSPRQTDNKTLSEAPVKIAEAPGASTGVNGGFRLPFSLFLPSRH
jgi:hypothetical protein